MQAEATLYHSRQPTGSFCLRAGLLCSTFLPQQVTASRPVISAAALLDTCSCVGASLASNATTARSWLGLKALMPVRPAV